MPTSKIAFDKLACFDMKKPVLQELRGKLIYLIVQLGLLFEVWSANFHQNVVRQTRSKSRPPAPAFAKQHQC